ncbi:hypothetical protein NQ317_018493 [Molorchus minor]|uniref:RNase H type-1 domain-containing protein n=1 Tax=Molorchus minor TaxID=1323400 RepID=A0ABQ9JZM6_9CUCU|nr:hypothetical protein NQ317_018493 [Molorchus minor]
MSLLSEKILLNLNINLVSYNIENLYILVCGQLVFHAEGFAILTVASQEEVKSSSEPRVSICSDSQAALKAVFAPRTRSVIGNALEELARHKEVTLIWNGVPGNEKADELARLGSEGRCLGPSSYLGITKQQVTAALNDWAYCTSKEHWRLSRGCRQARDFVTGPDPARSIWILGRSRGALNQLVGILTGHCKLRQHLSLLGIEEDSILPKVRSQDDETSYHFVGKCEAFMRLRLVVFGSRKLTREELDSPDWSDILTFIRRSGRFREGVGRLNR